MERHSERERLFKLIRGDEDTSKALQRRKSLEIGLKKLKELTFLTKQSLLEFFHKLRKGEISFSKLSFSTVRMVLVGILSIMFVYLVSDFASGVFLQKEVTFSAQRRTQDAQRTTQIVKLSPLDYYLSQIGGKDLFSPQRIELIKAKGEIPSGQPTAGFKLVGVDWGGNPVALIEDTQTQKTYFVKKGDSIKELMVMEIFRDRVKLRYGNKVIELK